MSRKPGAGAVERLLSSRPSWCSAPDAILQTRSRIPHPDPGLLSRAGLDPRGADNISSSTSFVA
ncbi:hypothetical protein NHF46_14375 [Arthrobacter alpinus]|nr:hypothetical protein [Arthrobacter alpinus]